jgi:hypothetical protein
MDDPENYTKKKIIIDLAWANVLGVLMLIPIIIVYGVPYFLVWGYNMNFMGIREFLKDSPSMVGVGALLVLAVLISGIVLHELIHGLVWANYAKEGFKSIRFGVLWKMVTPYCHCKEPLKVKEYIIGAIMPSIVLGLLPALVAIITGNVWLLLFGMIFTMASCGDFLIVLLLRKENMNDLVLDHPSEAGCYIFRKEKEHNKTLKK